MSLQPPHVIYAHREDEIATLLDVIDRTPSSAVMLVVPTHAAIFQDTLNVKILKRECEKLGKSLTLSTQDAVGTAMAKKAGIAIDEITEGEKFLEEWSSRAQTRMPLTVSASMSQTKELSRQPFSPQRKGRAMDVVVRRSSSISQPAKLAPQRMAEIETLAKEEPAAEPMKTVLASLPETPEKLHRSPQQTRPASPAQRGEPMPARSSSALVLGVFLAVIVALVGGALYFVKPSATATVYPKEEAVEFEMELSGRADVSSVQAEKAVIPLERVSVEETTTQEFLSTGDRDVATKARGKLTISNNFSAASQPLVATTRFLSDAGMLFRTPKAVVIPGTKVVNGTATPGTLEIEVMADQAGAEFNIGPSRFTIPGFAGTPRAEKFSAKSNEPMTGGFKGKTRVVEKKDIEGAKAVLVPAEIARVGDVLKKRLPPDLTYIESALTVTTVEVSVSPQAGEPGEKFTLTVRSKAEALLFREKDVFAVVEPAIAMHLASSYRTLPDTRSVTYATKQFDATLGRLVFTALVSVRTQAAMDGEEFGRTIAGMSLKDAKTFFADDARINQVDLSLWPFWAQRLPQDPARITVKIGRK